MTAIIAPVVMAAFPSGERAEGAIDQLSLAGFTKDQIGLAVPGEDFHLVTTATAVMEETATRGAVTGALVGSTVGTLAGAVAVSVLPGLGPILAGGLLLGIATGTAAGAALGTFAGPFLALGMSPKAAHTYEATFRAGHALVAVKTTERQEEATAILKSHGPLYVEVAGQRRSLQIN